MPRHTAKETLVGHANNEQKYHLLGRFTKSNMKEIQKRIEAEHQDRNMEMEAFNLQAIKDRAEFFRNQLRIEKRENQNKLTLKERLIQQKQERLNQDMFNRTEERRLMPTSLPFRDQIRPVPLADGLHHKFV